MRRVILIPVIHNAADLGSLAESVRKHWCERLGPDGWTQRQRAVANLWKAIRQSLDALHLDLRRVRVYQDGLPVCGKELQIVDELAKAGSLNHQLLVELARNGATVMGTEDPPLLVREYQLQRAKLGVPGAGAQPAAGDGELSGLLAARDRFIADRIASTLDDGETGLLLLGASHRVDAELRKAGIDVTRLDCAG